MPKFAVVPEILTDGFLTSSMVKISLALLAVSSWQKTRHSVMAYIVMAYIVMAYIVMAYIVMAYIVMACMIMACIIMACVVMAEDRPLTSTGC